MLPLPGIESLFPCRLAGGLITILTGLSRLVLHNFAPFVLFTRNCGCCGDEVKCDKMGWRDMCNIQEGNKKRMLLQEIRYKSRRRDTAWETLAISRWKNNLKVNLRKSVWTGFNWHRIGSNVVLFVNWTFGFRDKVNIKEHTVR